MRFKGRYKTQYYFDIFIIYFLFYHLCFRKTEEGFFLLTRKGQFKLFIIFIQRMVSLMVILFTTKCFLFVYMYIDLLKLKAYTVFENSDADLSWLLFFFFFKAKVISCRSVTCVSWLSHTCTYTNLFPKPPTTFLKFFLRGERRKYAVKKFRLKRVSNSQPPGHESNTPLSHPGGATLLIRIM